MKLPGDTFTMCTACKKYKGLQDAHPIGIKSHTKHQRKYIEHLNNQDTHSQNYYKIRAISIIRPVEVSIVIYDKMHLAKNACPCYACKIKATDGLFVVVEIPKCVEKLLHLIGQV